MNYILFGEQDLMLKNRLKKIVSESIGTPNDFNYVFYNYNECEVLDVMLEATLVNLSGDRRIVVLDNATFLTKEKSKKVLTSEEEKTVLDYIAHPNLDVDFIFVVHNAKIDDKNKIVKALKDSGRIIESLNPTEQEWYQYTNNLFAKHGITASMSVKEEFTKRTHNDAMLMVNEVKKLALYNNEITMEDLNVLVPRPLEDKILNLLNLIVSNQKKEAVRLYRDLIKKNEEPVAIVGLLATQLRTLVDVFSLREVGMSQPEMAEYLKIHPYRVKLALDNTCYVDLATLKEEVENLYQLDFAIKSGKVDRFFGLEMFILNFNKKNISDD